MYIFIELLESKMMFQTVFEVLIHISHSIYIHIVSFIFLIRQLLYKRQYPEIPSCTHRVAVITGGGSGIGLETSMQLLKKGVTVVIIGLKDDLSGIKKLQQIENGKVYFLECDLSSLEDVRALKERFAKLNLPLHLLILNAGIMFAPRMHYGGIEGHFLINYLSQFLLAHLLLENLSSSSTPEHPSRIVTLSSCLHYCGRINFKDLQAKQFYNPYPAYCQSKLAMVMFVKSLSRFLAKDNINILVNSVHPAVVFSGLMKHSLLFKFPSVCKRILETPEGGAANVLYAALDQRVNTSGNYFDNCQKVKPSSHSLCIADQDRLWQLSCDLLQLEKFGVP